MNKNLEHNTTDITYADEPKQSFEQIFKQLPALVRAKIASLLARISGKQNNDGEDCLEDPGSFTAMRNCNRWLAHLLSNPYLKVACAPLIPIIFAALLKASEARGATINIPRQSVSDTSNGVSVEPLTTLELAELVTQINNLVNKLSEENKSLHPKPATRVGVAPLVPKEVAVEGDAAVARYVREHGDELLEAFRGLLNRAGMPEKLAGGILFSLLNPAHKQLFTIEGASLNIGHIWQEMLFRKADGTIEFTGPCEWKGTESISGDYLVIPRDGKYYLFFIPRLNETRTGNTPNCNNVTAMGVFEINMNNVDIVFPTPEPTPTPRPTARPTSTPTPEKESPWEVSVGYGSILLNELLESRFNLSVSYHTTENPDQNGNYRVWATALPHDIEGDINPSDFDFNWRINGQSYHGQSIDFEMQKGTTIATVEVTVKGKKFTRQLQITAPGQANPPSNSNSLEEDSLEDGMGPYLAITYKFRSGTRIILNANQGGADIGAGYGWHGEHWHGNANGSGGYQWDGNLTYLRIAGELGRNFKGGLGLSARANLQALSGNKDNLGVFGLGIDYALSDWASFRAGLEQNVLKKRSDDLRATFGASFKLGSRLK